MKKLGNLCSITTTFHTNSRVQTALYLTSTKDNSPMNTGGQLGAEYLPLLVRIFIRRGVNSTHTFSELSLT